jgi:hypothetical protein
MQNVDPTTNNKDFMKLREQSMFIKQIGNFKKCENLNPGGNFLVRNQNEGGKKNYK